MCALGDSLTILSQEETHMKKVVLTFGLIGGAIMAFFVFLVGTLHDRDLISPENGELVGYATMVISLAVIFFGIKSYRDNYSGGSITFWKGIQIGLLISVIGGVLYFVGVEGYNLANPEFAPKFMKKWADHEADKARARGASEDEIATARKQIEDMDKVFANPFFMFLICLMEISPVGIIITVISAALLRKKEMLPAENSTLGYQGGI